MKLEEVAIGQKFRIKELKDRSENMIFTVRSSDTKGKEIWGPNREAHSYWHNDTEIELVDIPQDQAIADVQTTDTIAKDETYEVSINVETTPEQQVVINKIREIVKDTVGAVANVNTEKWKEAKEWAENAYIHLNWEDKNWYSTLEDIHKAVSSLAVGYDAADWKEEILSKLQKSIDMGLYINNRPTE